MTGGYVVSNNKNPLGFLPPVEDAKSKKDELIKTLTPREMEVLALVARGYTNIQIADVLCISKHTVKNHVSNIYRKLKIDDRTKIALLAIRNGLVTVD